MDEVRTERLVETHGDNVMLVMLREWPKNEEYVDEPEMLAGLERQVSVSSSSNQIGLALSIKGWFTHTTQAQA